MNDNRIENTVNVDKTNLAMPIWKQVIAICATVSVTATILWYIFTTVFTFAETDRNHDREIKTLQETKLDKSDYEKDTIRYNAKFEKLQKGIDDIKDYFGIKR